MMKFLQDDAGNNSSMRLAMFLMIVTVMAGWFYTTIINKAMQDVPAGLASIVIASFAAKVWQKDKETK